MLLQVPDDPNAREDDSDVGDDGPDVYQDEFNLCAAIQEATNGQDHHLDKIDSFLPPTRTLLPSAIPSSGPVFIPPEPASPPPPLPEPPATPTHRFNRMQAFKMMRKGIPRKVREERKRVKKAIERARMVPFDFSDLRSSLTIRLKPKVYRLEELEKENITVVKWDGL